MKIYLPYFGIVLGGLGFLTLILSLFFSDLCCYSLIFFIAAVLVFIVCTIRGCICAASKQMKEEN